MTQVTLDVDYWRLAATIATGVAAGMIIARVAYGLMRAAMR